MAESCCGGAGCCTQCANVFGRAEAVECVNLEAVNGCDLASENIKKPEYVRILRFYVFKASHGLL